MFLGIKHLGYISLLLIISCESLWSQTSASVTPPACHELVGSFLALPNKSSLSTLVAVGSDNCWSEFDSSNANLDKLEHWVEQGNRWGAEYLSRHLKQLDGGNLEDALAALGQFSDHDMERLLWFAKSGLLTKRQPSDALTMLPLSLSDDPKAQLAWVNRRRASLTRVTAKELSEQRDQGVRAMDSFAAEIRSKNPGSD